MITVDLYGETADYVALESLCRRFEVPLIEDSAEALGATYRGRAAGSFGVAGIFSFNGNKIITTSGGGMLVTQSPQLAERARHLATQAREPFSHYEHTTVGYNYRLSNLLGRPRKSTAPWARQPHRAPEADRRGLHGGTVGPTRDLAHAAHRQRAPPTSG